MSRKGLELIPGDPERPEAQGEEHRSLFVGPGCNVVIGRSPDSNIKSDRVSRNQCMVRLFRPQDPEGLLLDNVKRGHAVSRDTL